MSHEIPAEIGATPASVVRGLGYPNGRAEVSPSATGWRASQVLPDGRASQSSADIETIVVPVKATLG